MRLRYTVPASADLDGILTYIASYSPQGATKVAARLQATQRLIEAFPYAGAQTRLPWLRRLKVSPYPYVVFYEVSEAEIVIHAILHSARRISAP